MKERLIINGYEIAGRMPIFKPEMRQAIRDGRKTQTRRTRGLEFLTLDHYGTPICDWGLSEPPAQYGGSGKMWRWRGQKPPVVGDWFVVLQSDVDDAETWPLQCPYGKVGDIRVMPEPLFRPMLTESTGSGKTIYKLSDFAYYFDDKEVVFNSVGQPATWRWKRDTLSSMFMPTEYGRTLCRTESMKIERLQDISDIDAIDEGAFSVETELVRPGYSAIANAAKEKGIKPPLGPGPKERFRYLWDSINAKKNPWSNNDWVWIPGFQRIAE